MKPLIGREITEQDKIQFKATFGTEIVRFMDPTFGFDIFAFDDYIKTPVEKSIKNWLKEKYGEKASQFIYSIISK